jgi:hypothetical protein
LGVRAVLGSGRAGDLLLSAVTAGCGRDPLHIFWERYPHLLEVMARERRIATHRELADMLELRDAAYAYWNMHPDAGAEWPDWPPSALAVARKLGEVPPDLEPRGPVEVVAVGDRLKASGRHSVRGRVRGSVPYPRGAFQAAARLLTAGEDKREIARATGISRKRIDKIELWLRPPRGGAVYELESAPLDENAVVLRRLK